MANNVVVQPLGGKKIVVDNVYTVKDAKDAAIKEAGLTGNYTATVNGDQQDDTAPLSDGDFVSLAQAVKGGA